MANFNLISAETLPLTRELAERFAKMPAAPVERDLQPRRVKHLAEKAGAGLLTPFSWSQVKLQDGTLVRMNGQHSSNMLIELNGSFPQGLYVHMDTYEVSGEDGQALLFRQFDDRVSGRSANDVSGAYQCLHEEIADVPRGPAKLAVEGACWHRKEVQGLPVPIGDERYTLMAETGLHTFIRFAGDIIGIKQPELRHEKVVAAMYATFNMNEVAAREFWSLVARGGAELDDKHPTTVLSCWLQQAKKKEFDPAPRAAHYYQACIHSWNAYREGAECRITLKRIAAAKELYSPHE